MLSAHVAESARMESSRPHGGLLWWLLVTAVVPLFNWWLGLWVVVLARDAAPLLVVGPILLFAESLAVGRLLRNGSARGGVGGTATMLLLTTFCWSCVVTLAGLSVQKGVFTL